MSTVAWEISHPPGWESSGKQEQSHQDGQTVPSELTELGYAVSSVQNIRQCFKPVISTSFESSYT